MQLGGCSNVSIISNKIISNSALDDGGGILFSNSTVDNFKLNELSANSAGFNGGGISSSGSDFTIDKCTIIYDTAFAGTGGGIFCNNSSPQIINSIIWGNSPDQMYQTGGSTIQATYCDIQQIWPGTGNILQYPMFADTANADYHISWDNYPVHDLTKSPCIDSGNPDPIYDDPDGTRADLGCYYFQQYLPTIILSTYNLEFGLIPVGNQSSLPLTIYCEGDSTLVIDEVLPSDPSFYTDFDSLNNTIPPGDSLLLTVTFEPQIARIFAETISILSNAGNNNSLTVPVSGDGGAVPDTVRNLTVAIEGSDAVLSWDEVTTSVTGYPLTTDAYLIFYSDSTVYGYPHYQYLIYTGDTTYTHAGVVQFAESMFYFVEGYYGEIEVLDELPSNGIPLSREEVHDILNVMIVFSERE